MDSAGPKPLAIVRIWRGRTRRADADAYEAYNYDAGIKPLIAKAAAVQTFRKDGAEVSEFVTISYWESMAAMASFAGDNPARVHNLPRDAEFLLELPEAVEILSLRVSHGRIP